MVEITATLARIFLLPIVLLLCVLTQYALGQTISFDEGMPADCACVADRQDSCDIGWRPGVAAVFVGQVVAADHGKLGSTDSVTFNLRDAFRGNPPSTVIVRVHTHDCSPFAIANTFEEGKEYLVYATKDEAGNLQMGSDEIVKNWPENPSCSWGAKELKYAKDDIDYWRSVPKLPVTGVVFGTAKKYLRQLMYDDPDEDRSYEMEPIARKVIVIKGNGHIYHVRTDSKGNFEVRGLVAGVYRVYPEYDPQHVLSPAKLDVTVAPKGCAEIDFRDGTLLEMAERKKILAMLKKALERQKTTAPTPSASPSPP